MREKDNLFSEQVTNFVCDQVGLIDNMARRYFSLALHPEYLESFFPELEDPQRAHLSLGLAINSRVTEMQELGFGNLAREVFVTGRDAVLRQEGKAD